MCATGEPSSRGGGRSHDPCKRLHGVQLAARVADERACYTPPVRLAQRLRFRPLRPVDEAFVTALGRRAFSRWSRDAGRSVAAMIAAPGARAEIVEQDGEPVGFAIVSFERLGRPFGPWPSPSVARLDAVAVASGAQHKGVGRALTRRAEAIAREGGAVVMTLMTAEGNLRARRMFGRGGFLPVVKLEGSYANGESSIEMFKPLATVD